MSVMASQITSVSIVYLFDQAKKISKLRDAGLCEGNSPVTCEFPAQMASNAENVPIWWRHHGVTLLLLKALNFSRLVVPQNIQTAGQYLNFA